MPSQHQTGPPTRTGQPVKLVFNLGKYSYAIFGGHTIVLADSEDTSSSAEVPTSINPSSSSCSAHLSLFEEHLESIRGIVDQFPLTPGITIPTRRRDLETKLPGLRHLEATPRSMHLMRHQL
jgi:hypothetical protein